MTTIKDMPEQSRPRAKLREKGVSTTIEPRLASDLECEGKPVESNRKLIEIFWAKVNAKLDEIWGDGPK